RPDRRGPAPGAREAQPHAGEGRRAGGEDEQRDRAGAEGGDRAGEEDARRRRAHGRGCRAHRRAGFADPGRPARDAAGSDEVRGVAARIGGLPRAASGIADSRQARGGEEMKEARGAGRKAHEEAQGAGRKAQEGIKCWVGVVVFGTVLGGCGGGAAVRESFYTLSAPAAGVSAGASTAATSDVSIFVGPVSVPESVDRSQMVLRTGANEVEVSEKYRWAEPLTSAVPRVIAETLTRELGTQRVLTS